MANRTERKIVNQAARSHGINPNVLWGIYGAESSWGKASNWFGLVAVPRTGTFAGDANRSAATLSRLLKQSGGSYEQALRHYSGNSYGLAHIKALVGPVGNAPPPTGGHRTRTTRTTTTQAAPQVASVSPGGTGLADLLASQMDRPQPVQASLPTPPKFARQVSVQSYGPPAPQGASLDDLLGAVGSLQGPDLPSGGGSTTSTRGAPRPGRSGGRSTGSYLTAGGGAYPVAKRGKIIGVPYQGTHTLGNWQSDNAVDISVPFGTPIIARTSGSIRKTGGHAGTQGRFAGFDLTLDGHGGNAYFYTHLSKLLVHPGQHVKKGQVIGYSGAANGVNHLHFGVEHGNPLDLLGLR